VLKAPRTQPAAAVITGFVCTKQESRGEHHAGASQRAPPFPGYRRREIVPSWADRVEKLRLDLSGAPAAAHDSQHQPGHHTVDRFIRAVLSGFVLFGLDLNAFAY